MGRYEHIKVKVEGRSFAGDYTVEGKEICVGSAYGSRRAPIKRSEPAKVAQRVLTDLAREWLHR